VDLSDGWRSLAVVTAPPANYEDVARNFSAPSIE
jgi:hypothetical protein